MIAASSSGSAAATRGHSKFAGHPGACNASTASPLAAITTSRSPMTKPRYPQAILISCEVPWDENEQLLEDVFRQEIRHALDSFSHVYIFGTAGEGYAVDTPR